MRSGIHEYCLVDPSNIVLIGYRITEGHYVRSGVYGKDDLAPSGIVEDFSIALIH